MRRSYELHLLTDAAITRRSATVGGHATLQWVPGQCVLGAAAARCYASLARADRAWAAFHAGAVRFGDARRVLRSTPSWPSPMCLHHPKHDRDTASLVNALHHPLGGGTQWKQLRDTFVTLRGEMLSTASRRSMRTAIGAKGQARDGYLFELEAIPAGSVLRGVIEGDDTLVEAIVTELSGRELRLGRSRSAEFGRARFDVCDDSLDAPPSLAPHRETRVSFWCLSDLCLRDPVTGQPTLIPSAEHVGLPEGWRYDPVRSFVKTRRYTPFNGHRVAYDLERQVLSAGGVISFVGDRPLSSDEWAAVLSQLSEGVGEHRGEGLGSMVFEPELLSAATPRWTASPAPLQAQPVQAPALPGDELAVWLKAEIDAHAVEGVAWDAVHAQLAVMRGERRAWQQVPNAQWGEVRALARRYRTDGAALRDALAQHVGHVEEGRGSEQTRQSTPRGARARLWAGWKGGVQPAKALCGWYSTLASANPAAAPMALELLASHAVRSRKNPEQQGGPRAEGDVE